MGNLGRKRRRIEVLPSEPAQAPERPPQKAPEQPPQREPARTPERSQP